MLFTHAPSAVLLDALMVEQELPAVEQSPEEILSALGAVVTASQSARDHARPGDALRLRQTIVGLDLDNARQIVNRQQQHVGESLRSPYANREDAHWHFPGRLAQIGRASC